MALEDGRLFRPYQAEAMGGKRRDRDGLYASLSAIYWTVSAPKGAYIGATTPGGQNETRDYFTGSAIRSQTNDMSASNFSEVFNMGTRVEVGNRRGHHGWHVSGFGLPSTSSTIIADNVNFVIRDEGSINLVPTDTSTLMGYMGGAFVTVWDPNAAPGHQFENKDLVNLDPTTPIYNVGRLWGWFPLHYDPGPVFTDAKLAPVPIMFHKMNVTNRVENWGLELSYTYRTHPFKWGGLELMAGARYWEFDDNFVIVGTGPEALVSDLVVVEGEDGEGGGGALTETPYPNVNAMGPVSLLATLDVDARGLNRIIGPQFGAKFQRQNGRWTFGSEIRFMAGINNQSLRTQGYLGKHLAFNGDMGYWSVLAQGGAESDEEGGGANYPGTHVDTAILDQMWQQGVYPWLPVGMTGTGNYFNHKLSKTYFSPVVEWRIDADWKWTDALSFNVGFNTTFADNIARGYRITDFKVDNTSIFGIRGSRNTSVLVYGVNFGLRLQR